MDQSRNSTGLTPKKSYTIWFSQRTGSTLLSQALGSTGIAGKPGEWLLNMVEYLKEPVEMSAWDLRSNLWQKGLTPNGVFGLKFSFYEPFFSQIISFFKSLPECQGKQCSRREIWASAFPNGNHIFMTRRNKIRLAVSWWRAIQSDEWHRARGTKPLKGDRSETYSFEAINHLLLECTMREAGIQAFYAEAGIQPLTIVYEDFISDYNGTIKNILRFLELENEQIEIHQPRIIKLADDLSEDWVQRFRHERQKGWKNRGW